jgi:ubiquinone/menaquinone biosynthesis C-methylase UbiE
LFAHLKRILRTQSTATAAAHRVRRTVLCDRGEEEFRRQAAARSLRLNLRQADADTLPFADENFDYMLS